MKNYLIKVDGVLFHYTKFEKFKLIMEDLTLLPSSFERLNDMNEGNVQQHESKSKLHGNV